ncbi:MAG TPA: hypothetical protein HPP76_07415 [Desulfuromonadales bacterium]|nr:hypothetical protein [Desulfuromonadales bacterium]
MKALLSFAVFLAFLVIIFFDQNNVHVPMKIIVGRPMGMRLSLIILASMGVGMAMASAGFLAVRVFIRSRKERD